MSHWEETTEKTQDTETTSLSWPGNALESSQKSWRMMDGCLVYLKFYIMICTLTRLQQTYCDVT